MAEDTETPDLDISVDKVAEAIILGRDLDQRDTEFDALIESLTEEEQASLVAIFWIGRGSFDAEDYEEALNTALTEATTPTAEYLKGSLHLADHLENGLEALGISFAEAEEELYRA